MRRKSRVSPVARYQKRGDRMTDVTHHRGCCHRDAKLCRGDGRQCSTSNQTTPIADGNVGVTREVDAARDIIAITRSCMANVMRAIFCVRTDVAGGSCASWRKKGARENTTLTLYRRCRCTEPLISRSPRERDCNYRQMLQRARTSRCRIILQMRR